jgi:biotin carboxyl carrier protein
MANRVHLSDGDRDWTADVTGNEVSLAGEPGSVSVRPGGDGRFEIDLADSPLGAIAAAAGDVVWIGIDGHVFELRVTAGAARRGRAGARDQDAFTPPMPATVVRILVKPGDTVRTGDVLIALEAMKMELPIRAPRDGVVHAIHCREGELVQPGSVLLEFKDADGR